MEMALYTLGTLFVIGNAIAIYAYLRGKKSLGEREENAALFWESLHTGLGEMSQGSRNWIRQTFDSEFSLRNLMVVLFLATFAVLALIAEYSFLQQTFALVLQETDDAPAIIGLLHFSHLLAIFICACSGIAGIFAADVTRTFWFKLFAWNVLFVICLIEAYFGYTRATEFTVLGSLQHLLQGNAAASMQPLAGFPVVNAVLGFINPLLAAVTVRYLITLTTWLVAAVFGVALFFALWLPTWVAGNRVLKYKRGLKNRAEDNAEVNQTAAGPVELRPGSSGAAAVTAVPVTAVAAPTVTAPVAAVPAPVLAVEQAGEVRAGIREYEEAERRRRERANANPFA